MGVGLHCVPLLPPTLGNLAFAIYWSLSHSLCHSHPSLLHAHPAPGLGFAGLGWLPGVPLGIFADSSVSRARRERSKVPYIVRQCIEEVEKRGIEEVGIYRISGVATDIQALKAVFDASECPGGAWCSNGRVPRC